MAPPRQSGLLPYSTCDGDCHEPASSRCDRVRSRGCGVAACCWPASWPTVIGRKQNQGGPLMTTRRDFLKTGVGAATGIAFCGCSLLQSAHAQQQLTRQKLPVSVNGRRVKTIDLHSHCVIHEATALLGDEGAKAVL